MGVKISKWQNLETNMAEIKMKDLTRIQRSSHALSLLNKQFACVQNTDRHLSLKEGTPGLHMHAICKYNSINSFRSFFHVIIHSEGAGHAKVVTWSFLDLTGFFLEKLLTRKKNRVSVPEIDPRRRSYPTATLWAETTQDLSKVGTF